MSDIDQQLRALKALSTDELHEQWRTLMKSEPPRLSPNLLRLMLGYQLQERRFGAAPAPQVRELRRLASGKPASAPTMKPGTRLVRSWNGRSISVAVTDDGYLFEEHRYTSLSAIARHVTGTAWSGPRFFGLTAVNRG